MEEKQGQMDISVRRIGTISLAGGHVASFSPGPDGLLYVLVCTGEPDRNWVKRDQSCDWRVLGFHPGGRSSELLIQKQKDNFNLVQSVHNGILLGTRRCEYAGDATEGNGCLFDNRGQQVDRLLLGDGIADLQPLLRTACHNTNFQSTSWTYPLHSKGLVQTKTI